MSRLLMDEAPLQCMPSLAVLLKSSDRAIMLQQLHYWIQRSTKIVNGRCWVYNTIKDWNEQFPWMSSNTVDNNFKYLESHGFIITGNFNKAKWDRTKWYTIDYKALDNAIDKKAEAFPKNCEMGIQDLGNGTTKNCEMETTKIGEPIPIDYTENTQEITKETCASDDASVSQLELFKSEFEKLWKKYPNKKGKKQAFNHYKAWRKQSRSHTFEYINQRLEEYLKYIQVNRVQPRYILHGSTWFNGRFEDELDVPSQSNGAGFDQLPGNIAPTIDDIDGDDLPF